jgi:hypothetical protein
MTSLRCSSGIDAESDRRFPVRPSNRIEKPLIPGHEKLHHQANRSPEATRALSENRRQPLAGHREASPIRSKMTHDGHWPVATEAWQIASSRSLTGL